MTSPAPLTDAEKAAASEVQNFCSHTGPSTDPASLCGECDKVARAVVAAVRHLIEADAIDAFADAIDAYGPPSAIHTRGVAFVVRQGRMTVRDWLASDASLSLPASKETAQ